MQRATKRRRGRAGAFGRHVSRSVATSLRRLLTGGTMPQRIRVAIVGLGFGAEFIPIYQSHPDAEMYAVCRRDKAGLEACGDKFKIAKRYTSYEDLLKDPNVTAGDINSPIAEHAPTPVPPRKG